MIFGIVCWFGVYGFCENEVKVVVGRVVVMVVVVLLLVIGDVEVVVVWWCLSWGVLWVCLKFVIVVLGI